MIIESRQRQRVQVPVCPRPVGGRAIRFQEPAQPVIAQRPRLKLIRRLDRGHRLRLKPNAPRQETRQNKAQAPIHTAGNWG